MLTRLLRICGFLKVLELVEGLENANEGHRTVPQQLVIFKNVVRFM